MKTAPGEEMPQSTVCDHGSVERFDSTLTFQQLLRASGPIGMGVAVSSFELAAGTTMLGVAHASEARLDLYPVD